MPFINLQWGAFSLLCTFAPYRPVARRVSRRLLSEQGTLIRGSNIRLCSFVCYLKRNPLSESLIISQHPGRHPILEFCLHESECAKHSLCSTSPLLTYTLLFIYDLSDLLQWFRASLLARLGFVPQQHLEDLQKDFFLSN